MKKEKVVMIVTISIMSVLLACVIFMQFKVVNETNIEQIESMREDELKVAIAKWKEKYEDASKQLVDTNKKINEYRDKLQDNEEIKELVSKELTDAQKSFGLTEVTGEGIIVTLEDTEEKQVRGNDLLDLVNELRDAESEAISINNIRITNLTDIVEVGEQQIRVDSSYITSPYTIKAIGDRTYLKSALTIKNGYYDLKQKEGYDIHLEESKNIKINPYSKDINLRYIQF